MNEQINKKKLKAALVSVIVFAALLLLIAAAEITVSLLGGNIDYIKAGERWSADGERYAVISRYSEEGTGADINQIEQWTHTIDAKLLEASISSENGRSWSYCYTAEDKLKISGSKGSADAAVMAVGGDFFTFHRLNFEYGSGFLNDLSNPMGVVLDRDLAWKLFGAENIIGMEVSINDVDYVIVGITAKESNASTYKHVYGSTPRIYMSYAGYSKISSKPITSFEAALPNPVKGFAREIFESCVSKSDDTTNVFESSARYSIKNRWDNIKQLKYSWIRLNKISYPYWENQARVYDNISAVLMIFEIIFASLCLIALVLCIVFVATSGYSLIKNIKNIFGKLIKKIKGFRRSTTNE